MNNSTDGPGAGMDGRTIGIQKRANHGENDWYRRRIPQNKGSADDRKRTGTQAYLETWA